MWEEPVGDDVTFCCLSFTRISAESPHVELGFHRERDRDIRVGQFWFDSFYVRVSTMTAIYTVAVTDLSPH